MKTKKSQRKIHNCFLIDANCASILNIYWLAEYESRKPDTILTASEHLWLVLFLPQKCNNSRQNMKWRLNPRSDCWAPSSDRALTHKEKKTEEQRLAKLRSVQVHLFSIIAHWIAWHTFLILLSYLRQKNRHIKEQIHRSFCSNKGKHTMNSNDDHKDMEKSS